MDSTGNINLKATAASLPKSNFYSFWVEKFLCFLAFFIESKTFSLPKLENTLIWVKIFLGFSSKYSYLWLLFTYYLYPNLIFLPIKVEIPHFFLNFLCQESTPSS